jgi:hypothetical protein
MLEYSKVGAGARLSMIAHGHLRTSPTRRLWAIRAVDGLASGNYRRGRAGAGLGGGAYGA